MVVYQAHTKDYQFKYRVRRLRRIDSNRGASEVWHQGQPLPNGAENMSFDKDFQTDYTMKDSRYLSRKVRLLEKEKS